MARIKIASTSVDKCSLSKFNTEKVPGLRLPTIQREFVWDAEDIKDLLDSIIQGYPIGAIILWKPDVDFPSVPLMGEDKKTKSPIYILDGQQRITSLMLVMNGWKIKRGTKEIPTTPIRFVPESEKFYIGERKGIDVSQIVQAAMADSDALINLQKNYPTTYKKAIDIVGSKIANYELPLYTLESHVTEDNQEEIYEGIAEIFTRVNSAGQPIGNLQMFLSFFAAAFPREAKDAIINVHEQFSETFELDLEPIIRFVFSKMGMSQNQITKVKSFKPAIKELKEKYKGEQKQILSIIANAKQAISVVLGVFEEELGVSSTKFVPSQINLLPLFEYVYNLRFNESSGITQGTKNKMMKWFLISSFNGLYSTSTNRRLQEDIEIVRGNKRFPAQKLFDNMRERIRTTTIEKNDLFYQQDVLRGRAGVEYLMLLDALLYRNKATDWAGKLIVSENTAIHHIFPREYLRDNEITDPKLISCIANLTLIDPGINSEIGEDPPEKHIPEYVKDVKVRDDHFIPGKPNLLKTENFERFLDERLKLIWKATKDLLKSLD